MHEGLCRCSDFTRLLAIALLNWSDDEGYFMANPILIRGQVFPFLDDSKIIPRSLQDLSRVGWIDLGIDDQGRDVGMIKNFAKHQRVDKPKTSSIKGNFMIQDASKINPRRIQDASKEEGKGMEWDMEGKGMELLSVAGREEAIDHPLLPLADSNTGDYSEAILTLWQSFPPKSRDRSSKKKVAEEWRNAKRKPPVEEVSAKIQAWATWDEWKKDNGQYCTGAHIWIKERRWESEIPTNHPTSQPSVKVAGLGGREGSGIQHTI